MRRRRDLRRRPGCVGQYPRNQSLDQTDAALRKRRRHQKTIRTLTSLRRRRPMGIAIRRYDLPNAIRWESKSSPTQWGFTRMWKTIAKRSNGESTSSQTDNPLMVPTRYGDRIIAVPREGEKRNCGKAALVESAGKIRFILLSQIPPNLYRIGSLIYSWNLNYRCADYMSDWKNCFEMS